MSEGKTFKEAFSTLQRHAQTLRSQHEPDIDNLTRIVSESVAAFRVCKERIDAVEKALEEALGSPDAAMSDAPVVQLPASSGRRSPGSSSPDDDVPF